MPNFDLINIKDDIAKILESVPDIRDSILYVVFETTANAISRSSWEITKPVRDFLIETHMVSESFTSGDRFEPTFLLSDGEGGVSWDSALIYAISSKNRLMLWFNSWPKLAEPQDIICLVALRDNRDYCYVLNCSKHLVESFFYSEKSPLIIDLKKWNA